MDSDTLEIADQNKSAQFIGYTPVAIVHPKLNGSNR